MPIESAVSLFYHGNRLLSEEFYLFYYGGAGERKDLFEVFPEELTKQPRSVILWERKKFSAKGGVLDLFWENFNHRPAVAAGVMEQEGTELLKKFFIEKRIEKNISGSSKKILTIRFKCGIIELNERPIV